MSWIIYRTNHLPKRVLNCRHPRKQSTHNAALQNWHQRGSDTLPDSTTNDAWSCRAKNCQWCTIHCGLPEHICLRGISQTKTLSFSEARKIDASSGSRQLPTGPSFIGRWVEKICQNALLKNMSQPSRSNTQNNSLWISLTSRTQYAISKQCVCYQSQVLDSFQSVARWWKNKAACVWTKQTEKQQLVELGQRHQCLRSAGRTLQKGFF